MSSPTVIERMAAYSYAFMRREPAPEAIAAAQSLVLDTIAVAIRAHHEPAVAQTRAAVLGAQPAEMGPYAATLWLTGQRVGVDDAILVNGAMTRVLDYMDVYFSRRDASHPSEIIPVLIAVGEALDANGAEVLRAIALAYDLQGWFTENLTCNRSGWHHVTTGGFVAPAVIGAFTGLDVDQIANAMAIGGSASMTSLGVGPQTSMKAFAYPMVGRAGHLGVRLAAAGSSGPLDAVENFVRLGRIPASLDEPIDPVRPRILSTAIKPYPAEFLIHSSLEALEIILKEHPIAADDVARVVVRTHEWTTWVAREVSYDPQSREEADHSLPYCLAALVVDGQLATSHFESARWHDPEIRKTMARIEVVSDAAMEERYPAARPAEVELWTNSGDWHAATIEHPLGDPARPMSRNDLLAKYDECVDGVLAPRTSARLLECITDLPRRSVRDLVELLAVGEATQK